MVDLCVPSRAEGLPRGGDPTSSSCCSLSASLLRKTQSLRFLSHSLPCRCPSPGARSPPASSPGRQGDALCKCCWCAVCAAAPAAPAARAPSSGSMSPWGLGTPLGLPRGSLGEQHPDGTRGTRGCSPCVAAVMAPASALGRSCGGMALLGLGGKCGGWGYAQGMCHGPGVGDVPRDQELGM